MKKFLEDRVGILNKDTFACPNTNDVSATPFLARKLKLRLLYFQFESEEDPLYLFELGLCNSDIFTIEDQRKHYKVLVEMFNSATQKCATVDDLVPKPVDNKYIVYINRPRHSDPGIQTRMMVKLSQALDNSITYEYTLLENHPKCLI